MLLSLIVLGVLAAAAVVWIREASHHQAGGSPSAAGVQAATVNDLLTKSAKSRHDLAKALAEAERCSDMPRAIDRLKRAAGQRRSEAKAIAVDPTGALPNGSALEADLTRALRDSMRADEDFVRWARQWAACSAPPARTRTYREGASASRAATAEKRAFLRLWDPLAAQYGLPEWSQGKI